MDDLTNRYKKTVYRNPVEKKQMFYSFAKYNLNTNENNVLLLLVYHDTEKLSVSAEVPKTNTFMRFE